MLFLGLFFVFRVNRSRKLILIYLIGVIFVLEVCDVIWLAYLFPGGEYYNRGIMGAYIFFIFPILLLVLNVFTTMINKIQHK